MFKISAFIIRIYADSVQVFNPEVIVWFILWVAHDDNRGTAVGFIEFFRFLHGENDWFIDATVLLIKTINFIFYWSFLKDFSGLVII